MIGSEWLGCGPWVSPPKPWSHATGRASRTCAMRVGPPLMLRCAALRGRARPAPTRAHQPRVRCTAARTVQIQATSEHPHANGLARLRVLGAFCGRCLRHGSALSRYSASTGKPNKQASKTSKQQTNKHTHPRARTHAHAKTYASEPSGNGGLPRVIVYLHVREMRLHHRDAAAIYPGCGRAHTHSAPPWRRGRSGLLDCAPGTCGPCALRTR